MSEETDKKSLLPDNPAVLVVAAGLLGVGGGAGGGTVIDMLFGHEHAQDHVYIGCVSGREDCSWMKDIPDNDDEEDDD